MKEKIFGLILKSPKLFSLSLYAMTVIFCGILLNIFEEKTLETNAIEDSRLYSEAIATFRTIYSREVVAKVRSNSNIEVTHKYLNNPNAIPLPSTFSILMGEEISKKMKGGTVKLYSPFPFPWRKETSNLTDDFKKAAWSSFQNPKNTEYYKFISEDGVKYIRYAIPDLMRESCIQCHNSHPESPKRDWKVGDLRGVLEVKRPIHVVNESLINNFNQTMFQLFLVVTGFLFVIYFLVFQLQTLFVKMNKKNVLIETQREEIFRASKMSAVGEMAGGIAHEINTPLGVLKLFIGQLRREISEVPDIKRIESVINKMDQTTDRMAGIVKSMRMLSRDGTQDAFQQIKVIDLIDEVTNILNKKFSDHCIHLKIHTISNDLTINCRVVEIGQVLLNLLSNAFDAVDEFEEKWVEINAIKVENYIEITVTDSGSGISKENIKKIFNPFFTTKPVGKGTGIGLSISMRIIKEHGGSLTVNSKSPNTQFVITLPTNE
jgi:signal transduction histidine kinase